MNWYQKYTFAASASLEGGRVCIKGNDTFPIKDQLGRLGFRWDRGPDGKPAIPGGPGSRCWSMSLAEFMSKDPSFQYNLKKLNVMVVPNIVDQPQSSVPYNQSLQPQQPVSPVQAVPTGPKIYYLANLIRTNEPVVMNKIGNMWEWITQEGKTGQFPATSITQMAKSVRKEDGKPYQSIDPKELFDIYNKLQEETSNNEEELSSDVVENTEEDQNKRASGMIPEHKMSVEQKSIETAFAGTNENIMIDALAGSGKTSMLKHLAWKYGKPGENWLYLVFNKKNGVEAKQKFPTDYVKVYTTNSFLGQILNTASSKGLIEPTTLLKKLEDKAKDPNTGKVAKKDQIPAKSELFVDGPQFVNMVRNFKILPQRPDATNRLDPFIKKNVDLQLSKIRKTFGRSVIDLTSKCKAFAVDPRKPDLRKHIETVLSKYDIDHDMIDIKETISKYKGRFRDQLLEALNAVLGYDFMQRSFKNECITSAEWMLKESLPGASKQAYNYQGKSYVLGEYRDFDDDLWYTAINADHMDWTNGVSGGFHNVLADEVQDFNECQKIALGRMKQLGSRVVAVGDPAQSLYRFRGADESAFDNIAKILGSKKYSLSLNFRSRPAIIKYVNDHTHIKNLKLGLKIDKYELMVFLSQPSQNPEDIEWMKNAQQVVGTDFNINSVKANIDAQKIPWPPSLGGKITYQDKEYNTVFEEIEAERKADKNTPTAFISRTNAPLSGSALKLLGKGVPFMIIGKDVAGELINHINTIKVFNKLQDLSPINQLMDNMQGHLESEFNKHENKAAKQGYLQDLNDTTEALISAIEQFGSKNPIPVKSPQSDDENYTEVTGITPQVKQPIQQTVSSLTIGGFTNWLKEKLGKATVDIENSEKDINKYQEEIENSKNPPVVLCTSHTSKGLEFHRVFVLRDDLFPHPRAKRKEDLQQEQNSKYVCYTRAQDELHIIKLEGQPGYKSK